MDVTLTLFSLEWMVSVTQGAIELSGSSSTRCRGMTDKNRFISAVRRGGSVCHDGGGAFEQPGSVPRRRAIIRGKRIRDSRCSMLGWRAGSRQRRMA
eukprot:674849-Pyramimonas_sp.AAC.1